MDPRISAGTPLATEDARRFAAALVQTDTALAEVERILEAAVARRETALKHTRRRGESKDTQ